MTTDISARVITVSDRCFAGQRADASGPLARDLLTAMGVRVDQVMVVPDGIDPVRAAIQAAIDDGRRLIFTTGGTGISPRDWTPEATEPLLAPIRRLLPPQAGLDFSPMILLFGIYILRMLLFSLL